MITWERIVCLFKGHIWEEYKIMDSCSRCHKTRWHKGITRYK